MTCLIVATGFWPMVNRTRLAWQRAVSGSSSRSVKVGPCSPKVIRVLSGNMKLMRPSVFISTGLRSWHIATDSNLSRSREMTPIIEKGGLKILSIKEFCRP